MYINVKTSTYIDIDQQIEQKTTSMNHEKEKKHGQHSLRNLKHMPF